MEKIQDSGNSTFLYFPRKVLQNFKNVMKKLNAKLIQKSLAINM